LINGDGRHYLDAASENPRETSSAADTANEPISAGRQTGESAVVRSTQEPAFAEGSQLSPGPEEAKESPRAEPPATPDALKRVVRDAALNHPASCNDTTAEVARAFGIDDLDGLDANQQLEFMKRTWDELDPPDAQDLANKARLVVAGKPGQSITDKEGNRMRAGGHVAIVVPGELAEGTHPLVAGGAGVLIKNTTTGRINLVRGPAFSVSGRSVARTWKPEALPQVRYYTPRAIPASARTRALGASRD
jgi:hypothetical protein